MDEQFLRQVKNLIATHEGRRSHVYLDTLGHPTIGIGFNLDRSGAGARIAALGLSLASVRSGDQDLTNEQIDTLFEADVESAIAEARQVVSSFDTLADNARLVLIDMVFNLGRAGLSHFQHMIAALNDGDYQRAAREMKDSLWARQVPVRVDHDIALMSSAQDSDNVPPSTEPASIV